MAAAAKETERVEKTIAFSPGGTLKLKNFSGKVEITGENRSDISLVAVRTATRDRLDHQARRSSRSGSTVTIEANKRDDSGKSTMTTSSRPTSRSRCPRTRTSTSTYSAAP